MIPREPPRTSFARAERCSRDGAGEASALVYPAIKRARLDQQQLAARHNLHKRLHVALEVRHAHSQRRGRLGPREQPARHRLDRTIRERLGTPETSSVVRRYGEHQRW